MSITISDRGIQFGQHSLAYADFTRLCQGHLDYVPGTVDLEAKGARLSNSGFPDDGVKQFVFDVCHWGGGDRVRGIVLSRNTLSSIASRLRDAWGRLGNRDVEGALARVNQIIGLGQPSYASKHLRFLRPDICPVLDSFIQDALGPRSYVGLAADYERIATNLQQRGIANPMNRPRGQWFVGDVDMAIFYRVRYDPSRDATSVAVKSPDDADDAAVVRLYSRVRIRKVSTEAEQREFTIVPDAEFEQGRQTSLASALLPRALMGHSETHGRAAATNGADGVSGYWDRLFELLRRSEPRLELPRIPTTNWVNIKVRDWLPKYKLNVTTKSNIKQIGVSLMIYGAGHPDRFDRLGTQKREIEKAIGERLDWHGSVQTYSDLILWRRRSDPRDPREWSDQHDWLVEKLGLFLDVLPPFLRAIK